VDDVTALAEIAAAHWALGATSGLVAANPVPAADELDAELHDRVLGEALALAEQRGVRGRDVTPMLLDYFHTATGGASLACNIALIRGNAELAARVADALAEVHAEVRAG
jgi:pseudouridine-5'-phosphate glycosidase